MSKPLLSMFIDPEPSDDELLFARQLGVDCVYTWIKTQQRTYEYLARLRERVESYGLRLYNVGNMDVAKNDKIHLALPGRDQAIADFQAFVRDLGRAGIGVTTFTWEPTQVWSSAPGETRGAQATGVDLDEMLRRPYTHGRAYSSDEIWDNYTYFIRQMMPVCAEAGVRLALHPNDPPSPQPLGGIPCLIHSFDTYRRAFAIADSCRQAGRHGVLLRLLAGGRRGVRRHLRGHPHLHRRGSHPDRPLPQRDRAAAASSPRRSSTTAMRTCTPS